MYILIDPVFSFRRSSNVLAGFETFVLLISAQVDSCEFFKCLKFTSVPGLEPGLFLLKVCTQSYLGSLVSTKTYNLSSQ